MACFDYAPEFIEEDNRRFRTKNPVSREQMAAKHEVLLPPHLLAGASVLDLGCCLGATGHWVLSHGAAQYTGVEMQESYASGARRLLDRYHPGKAIIDRKPIDAWLYNAAPGTRYDIVCLLGVIYAFADYFSVLSRSAALSNRLVAIEALYPGGKLRNPHFCGVQFVDKQPINLADQKASLLGRGTRISPKGMSWLMTGFGFAAPDGLLFPRPIVGTPDVYNRELDSDSKEPVRYLMRFARHDSAADDVAHDLLTGRGETEAW